MNTNLSLLYFSDSEEDIEEIKLLYNQDDWQYKLINNNYIFKSDNNFVLKIYNLLYLKNKFNNTNNNTIKNNLFKILLFNFTEIEWENINSLVKEIV
tara:strand:- start:2652 stop:2942 length:291 start_codon:yes stop_codon:yes gene_type:complete